VQFGGAQRPTASRPGTDGIEVTSRFLGQLRRRRRRPVARWFGEDVPLSAARAQMLVTEPLPFFIDRSIGVCGGGVYLRQIARGNAILGGGDGWAMPSAAARGR
jgi:sarcosine oxidase subunit beta